MALFTALHTLLSGDALLWLLAGSVVGIFVGALPGIGPLTGIALLLPLTVVVKPVDAILFYLTLYQAAEYGGSITAIAISSPGAPNSAALILDGFPMNRRGLARRAFGYSLWTACIISAATTVVLILVAGQIANFALAFGPADYAALGFLALVAVVLMLSADPWRGFVSVALGALLATVGTDPIAGSNRFTFGNAKLAAGIPLVPLLIGVFAVPVAVHMLVGGTAASGEVKGLPVSQERGFVWMRWRNWWSVRVDVAIGTVVGFIMGLLPGMSGSGPPFVAYNISKSRRIPRNPEFGDGAPGGIVTCEAANAASMHSTLVPTFALGVPGTPTSAIILAAMTIVGLQPGPQLFKLHPAVPATLFLGLFIGSFVLWFVAISTMNLWLYILRAPAPVLGAAILILGVIGSYAVSSSLFDVLLLFVFGVLGLVMSANRIPIAPLALAFILEPIIEGNLRQALLLSHTAKLSIFTDPIVDICLVLAAVVVWWGQWVRRRSSVVTGREEVREAAEERVPEGERT